MTTRHPTRILVTGAAGFIGFHLCKKLIECSDDVIGIDNINNYYDVNLKLNRLKQLERRKNFEFIRMDLSDKDRIIKLFSEKGFHVVVNLAAGCRHNHIKHLVFASSSSVYGANTKMPFSVHHNVDHPVSLYAATKKANELMAHTYANLYNIPCTGLRFFTVYGPWGRPDMAYFLFTKAITEEKPIDVFNYGKMKRDFTYIDDIIEGVVRVINKTPEPNAQWSGDNPDSASSYAPYRLYNIGNNNPVELMRFIEVVEACLGKKAEKNFLPMQKGDVHATYADIDDLVADVGFKPSTPIEKGIEEFVKWYRMYYDI